MRLILLFFCACLLFSCGTDAPDSPPPLGNAVPENSESSPTPDAPESMAVAAVPTLEDQLTWIKEEYALIVREMAAEVYSMDSIPYTCDDEMVGGELLLFADHEETKVVINSFSMGDHSGKTEYWYFAEGKPFFVLEEFGTWSFGGPMEEDENGMELPGTIDKVEQYRYYIVDGEVVRELRKAVEMKSWEDGPSIDDIPNQEVKPSGGLPEGYGLIKGAMDNGNVDCGQVAM